LAGLRKKGHHSSAFESEKFFNGGIVDGTLMVNTLFGD